MFLQKNAIETNVEPLSEMAIDKNLDIQYFWRVIGIEFIDNPSKLTRFLGVKEREGLGIGCVYEVQGNTAEKATNDQS
uniref:DUF772 domain-containing protein n=1 Tax=Caenorhabditis tropicalis TaxID=1561998 RepID=A0A1I7TT59_9PELO